MNELVVMGIGVIMKVLTNSTEVIEKPEFIRVKEAVQRFGISKSKIHQLISDGLIKSSSLRGRGQVRATRLIQYDSLKKFIESKIEG
ncbi:helix-turn-helix domain-containing protein [Verrucomicrobia bacterium]|nr:helix-turn-helix domain-containing protein [Verrucomicrobiota bacterium]